MTAFLRGDHLIASTPANDSLSLDAQVQASIDDFADHLAATEWIMSLGDRATAPLCRYLREGAQVVPHGRLFAVSMLARLHSPAAREGLRAVLYDTSLRQFPDSRREAEYQVKDAVIRHLMAHVYPERLTDAAYAVREERLPSAVAMAGRLGLSSLAPVLVGMLQDDVLERASADSLEILGAQGEAAILQGLPALFESADTSARSRLGLLRALLLLHRMHASLPLSSVKRALADRHAAIRAAGALFLDRPADACLVELIHGALSDCMPLAESCRKQLTWSDGDFADEASEALRRNAEPDIYGNLHPLRSEAIRWLNVRLDNA